DIKQTFDLNLDSYKQYKFNQLAYLARDKGEFKTLFTIAETIVNEIINPMIEPPYKNVIDPVTYVNGEKGYILFKEVDGTNVVYEVRREKGFWEVVNKESKPGKRMEKVLLWYM